MGKIERIEVPAADRDRLENLVRNRNTPQKVVWRARIVLLAGEGLRATEVAARVGTSTLTVRRWRRRYAQDGVEGLRDYREFRVWVGHDGWKGVPTCRDGKNLVFRTRSWTSFWPGPIRRQPLIQTAFLMTSRRRSRNEP